MRLTTVFHRIAIICIGLLAASALHVPVRAQQPGRDICTDNESWVSLGGGLPGAVVDVAVKNGRLYALHGNSGGLPVYDTNVRISVWNGLFWNTVASVQAYPRLGDTSAYYYRFVEHNGEFFLSGVFSGVGEAVNSPMIVRWDGTRWLQGNAGMPVDLSHVTVFRKHRGELYCIANTVSGPTRVMRWNRDAWSPVGPSMPNEMSLSNDLVIHNGRLYVGGLFSDGSHASMLLRLDGNSWTMIDTIYPGYGYLTKLESFNGRLYGVGLNNGYDWAFHLDGDSLRRFAGPYNEPGAFGTALSAYNGQLYCASWVQSPRGDTGISCAIARYDGRQWHQVSNLDEQVDRFLEVRGTLYAVGRFTRSCSNSVRWVAMMCTERNCGSISGTVYSDYNRDCRQEGGEPGLRNQMIQVLPGPYHVLTDSNGAYRAFLPPGLYAATVRPWRLWDVVCPTPLGAHVVTITGAGQSVDGKDYALAAERYEPDLGISIAGGPVRAGRGVRYAIRYHNIGTIAAGGVVEMVLDPRTQFVSATPAPMHVDGRRIIWQFSNLEPGEDRTIYVTALPDQDVAIGTIVCAHASITTLDDGDIGRCHGTDSVCVPVTGGYDPNDLSVIPIGLDGEELGPEDSVLTYTVRFQNTGNDTAFRVVVFDTLSEHLDLTTLRLGAASHPYTLRIEKHSTLVWTFDEIGLPDSTTNEAASHGFLKFSVGLRRDLPGRTEIHNRASIYFDYNTPVMTNTVMSIVPGGVSSVGSGSRTVDASAMKLYPNPAKEQVHLAGPVPHGTPVELRDLLGRRLGEYRYVEGEGVVLDVRSLAAGAYLVVVHTTDGMMVLPLNVVR